MTPEQRTEELRAWLVTKKGKWDDVLKKCKVTRRTLTNIVNNPTITPRKATLDCLDRARRILEKQ